jgi:hypothetical protein
MLSSKFGVHNPSVPESVFVIRARKFGIDGAGPNIKFK